MRINSNGLEIEAQINQKELVELKQKGLTGILKFRDNWGSEKREIQVRIDYCKNQKGFINESHTPIGYFGNAKKIFISINQEFYESLEKKGQMSERYMTSGKLLIWIR